MTMSSRIAVMDAGRIVQVSTPSALYEYPATRFVAEFVGAVNMINATVLAQEGDRVTARAHDLGLDVVARSGTPIPAGTDVGIAVRPEKIDVVEERPVAADNVIEGKVVEIAYLGDISIYHVETARGFVLRVQETHAQRSEDPHYNWGDRLYLVWQARDAAVLMN